MHRVKRYAAQNHECEGPKGPTKFQSFIFFALLSTSWAGSFLITRVMNNVILFSMNFQDTSVAKTIPWKLTALPHLQYYDRLRNGSPKLILEWDNFTKQKVPPIRLPSKRLLIAQYSGFGKYEKMVDLTSSINKMYAKAWGHNFLVLRGTTKVLPFQQNLTTLPEEQSMYNKVDLLLMALENKDSYDQVLLLDSDTLIYDFATDLTQMMSSQNMLVALKTHIYDPPTTHRINNGITLWNLHHNMTPKVALDWDKGCNKGIRGNMSLRSDQFWLVEALKKGGRRNAIRGVLEEFHYRSGTIIKHFIRLDSCSWHDSGMNERYKGIQKAINEVTSRFQFDLETQEFFNSTALVSSITSKQSRSSDEYQRLLLANRIANDGYENTDSNFDEDKPDCDLDKNSTWKFHDFHDEKKAGNGTRLLIAQYTSFGDDDKYLNLTAPINALYAQKWNHDYLVVKGVALKTPLDGKCTVPPKRSKLNKISILAKALRFKDELKYDLILLLDDGALISDLTYDIRELSKGDVFLIAKKSNRCDIEKTWNIKNDITLWNLNHSKADPAIQSWFDFLARDVQIAQSNNSTTRGDENNLQKAIKKSNLAEYVRGLDKEFNVFKRYSRRTKDEILWFGAAADIQENAIKEAVETVCEEFSADCENLTKISDFLFS
jgi:hypothetical protein